ncbi:LLM class F420-dependent oxidoreductase [Frankia sp. CcI49]|uniref:TIGR03619 family F420-dependent LLM class oxidoreductase n=1 Tax=Frankia sp. CcI49 TaxID=1745382 RepID=UPI0009765805|nr:TIGR03619 family F420-dependent LLM class oxidoreductase [Frankia sp. CcI49]ONH62048.1 LLM class F420-dependent oxidoreductase [Frankia sp. CcI49]
MIVSRGPSVVPRGALAFGIQLPIQAQSSLFAEPWEATATPDDLAAIARAADEHGFLYVAVCDHVAIPRRLAAAMGTTWYDSVATLSWLAAATTRVRLLSHVYNLAYRHPLVTAKAFATLDRLSAGRVILGVGAGHVADEFAGLGLDFARRGRMLDDAIEVVDAALRTEFPTAANDSFTVDGQLGLAPRPVQDPRPPLWIGGSSPAAVRRAARLGDGWLPQGTPLDQLPPLVELLRTERAAAGVTQPCDIGAITDWLHLGQPTWDVGRPCRAGTPARLAEHLRRYRDVGVDHLQVRFPSRGPVELIDQIAAFGSEVGPLLTP